MTKEEIECIREGYYAMKELMEYNELQADSFEGNERQMLLDIAGQWRVKMNIASKIILSKGYDL